MENSSTKILILIALLVVAVAVAWFMFGWPEKASAPAQQALSTSDEVGAIEEDLNATVLPDIEAELKAIESELTP